MIRSHQTNQKSTSAPHHDVDALEQLTKEKQVPLFTLNPVVEDLPESQCHGKTDQAVGMDTDPYKTAEIYREEDTLEWICMFDDIENPFNNFIHDKQDLVVESHPKNRAPPPKEDDECDPDVELVLVEDSTETWNTSICITERRSSTTSSQGSIVKFFRGDKNVHRRRCLLGIALLAILAISILLFTWPLSSESESEQEYDTLVPSAAPTTFFNGVLPLYTRHAMDNPSSPQFRALYWLERDERRNSFTVLSALQRFVLATLFYATAGDAWDQAPTAPSECVWFSHDEVSSVCDSNGRIQTLSLPGNSLQGTLPEELELLSSLTIVQLQDNRLSGTLPGRLWSSWSDLVFFNVYNNSLEGSIPTNVASLANAKHLNTVSLRSNQFSGSLPSELGLLHLQFLSLSGNAFTGSLPSELGNLTNVRDLYLYDNQLTGTLPSTLGLLTRLRRLELHHNHFVGSVPQQVCDLMARKSLAKVTVDCDKVECTCGCECANALSDTTTNGSQ